MIAAWMLHSVVVACLAALAAAMAERVCGALRRPVRFAWAVAVVATVLLSALAAGNGSGERGAGDVAAPAVNTDAEGMLPLGAAGLSVWLSVIRGAAAAGEARVYGAVAGVGGAGRALLFGWALTSLVLASLFAAALLRSRRLRRAWSRHEVAGVPVYVAPAAGPAVVGLRRPAIVIPSWLLHASEAEQRLVVEHEQEHRRARDPLLLAGTCAVLSLMPWNPGLWWMLRRLRLAIELDCDARVLRRGVAVGDYGRLLLNVAARGSGLLTAPALADTRTHLERRILAMTPDHRAKAPRHVALAAASTLLAAFAACSADLPTAAEIDRMGVTAAESQAQAAGLIVSTGTADETPTAIEPLFLVDGVVTPAAEARAIAPERIASIEVTRASAATTAFGDRAAGGVVHVRTKGAPASAGAPADAPGDAGIMRRAERAAAAKGAIELRATPADVAPTQALIIIDGVAAAPDFTLNSLDPATIESVEVIKGAAAVKQYGARGANGVILVTRKR